MNPRRRKQWTLALGFACGVGWSGNAAGSGDANAFRGSLHLANDAAFLRLVENTDRFFSSGFGASFTFGGRAVSSLTNWLPDSAAFAPDRRAVGIVTAQLLFTPQDLTRVVPNPDDHPYAGYLYTGLFLQRSSSVTFEHLQLDVGVVGPAALGGDVQQGLHRLWGLTEPRGWDAQLVNELAIQATFRKKWRIELATAQAPTWGRVALQLIPETEASLGSVGRKLQAGALVRLGVALPDDFGPHQLLTMGSFTAARLRAPFSAYAYARVAARLVQADLFLQGNRAAGVVPEPLVGEAEFGAAFQYYSSPRSAWELTYGQLQLSREFTTEYLHHGYGTLSLSWLGSF